MTKDSRPWYASFFDEKPPVNRSKVTVFFPPRPMKIPSQPVQSPHVYEDQYGNRRWSDNGERYNGQSKDGR